jgi:hypothetical protein
VKSKPDTLPQQPIVFTVNVIAPAPDAPGGSRFFVAGEPTPYLSLDEVPPNLQPFSVSADDEPEAEVEGRANFELNTVYQLNSDGRLGRALSRQAAQLETENALRDWAEEQLNTPLAPEVADALQAQNDARVGRQMAEAESRARWRDTASEAAEGGEEL